MAINKKNASPAVKVGIIAVSVLLVLTFTLPLIVPGGFGGSTASTTGTEGQLDALAARYGGTIAGYQASLASDPTSYTVLVGLGNTYFDWGAEIQRAGIANGADQPMWVSAYSFYSRALEAQPGDPNVTTDAAISAFYSGDTASAISLIDGVTEANPEFSPGFFNAAIFYDAAGDAAAASAAASRFLELDPDGQGGNPQVMNDIIARSGTSSGTPTTTP